MWLQNYFKITNCEIAAWLQNCEIMMWLQTIFRISNCAIRAWLQNYLKIANCMIAKLFKDCYLHDNDAITNYF